MGYGLLLVDNKNVSMVHMGVLRLSAKLDAYERLKKIHQQVTELIVQYKPECFAIEAPFFGKNVQSMLKLGRAQGVAIAAAMQAGLSVAEYSPKKVKQSITGNGNASKEQVMKMMQRLLGIKEEPKYFDATDALSVALCHHYQDHPLLPAAGKKGSPPSGGKDWKDFIKQNPGRVG
ncbi:MAG: crossover junction endodeoxyribonuclease RuvC [Rhizobacter sp.]|nr:crossover junction endodeoxyribonuclease RuvC [Ferruginibacter sp.]